MSLRFRILASFTFLIIASFLVLAIWLRSEFKNSYSYVVEDALVDMSNLMSSILEANSIDSINYSLLSTGFAKYKERHFDAKIFDFAKDKPTLEAYITNDSGRVIYSTRGDTDLNQDYSQWNDVYLTLNGEYGARSTRTQLDDEFSSVYYVASPISLAQNKKGVFTIIKTEHSILTFLAQLIRRMTIASIFGATLLIALGWLIFTWFTRPLNQLRQYALAVADGERVGLPDISSTELRQLGSAFETMRIALEGKKTIEQYTQSLTHEMKSPLTAIRGAAELCREDLPVDKRREFVENIINESTRAQLILERLLKILELESMNTLEKTESINFKTLCNTVVERLRGFTSARNIQIKIIGTAEDIIGDPFLMEQCLRNLVQNAVEFSPDNSEILISLGPKSQLSIEDNGSGIPEFAKEKLFDKFFSLERPTSGKKGTGLGLSFVKQVVDLHHGKISINDNPGGAGTVVSLDFTCC